MNSRLITHSVTFLFGILLSYLFFRPGAPKLGEPINPIDDNDVLNHSITTEHQAENEILDYRQMVIARDKEITHLKSQLLNLTEKQQITPKLSDKNNMTEEVVANESEGSSNLKKMNFEDFEDTIKNSFNNRFKGIILELSGKKLNDIKKSFQQSSHTNEWSAQYENSIAAFLSDNDLNGDHFVQSLSCNSSVCRLEVNTNNPESWNNLYASMTEQDWYESITIQENSDYPGNIIYYLPSFKN